jgi:hypothetical protein
MSHDQKAAPERHLEGVRQDILRLTTMIDSSETIERVRKNINALGHPKDGEMVPGLWDRVALRIMSEYSELQELAAAHQKQSEGSGNVAKHGGNYP